jgi:hypothetical protein
VQTALATATLIALPRSRTVAQQETPSAGGEAAITASQVQKAVARLDGLIEDALTRTGVPGTAVAVVYRDAVMLHQLGVVFTIGPDGSAAAAKVSLGGVGPDAEATFTRVAAAG